MDHATRPITRIEAACRVDPADNLLVSGSDAPDLLQRICASDVLRRGEALCHHLVFTDDKAGLIDAPLGIAVNGGIRLVAGPGRGTALRAWISKWIIVEDVQIRTRDDDAWRLGEADLADTGVHQAPTDAGAAILDGAFDGPAVDSNRFEAMLLMAGRLQAGSFTASGPNPLELGWRSLIDFDKGCYIGQEVIARLDTYAKLRRGPGLAEFAGPQLAGSSLSCDGRRCGTSLGTLEIDGRHRGWVIVNLGITTGTTLDTDSETAGTLLQAPAVD